MWTSRETTARSGCTDRRGGLVFLVVVMLLASAVASAQRPSNRPKSLSLNDLAIDFAQGEYISPLVCKIDGRPMRGLRRVVIEPGPATARPPVARIRFVDLEPEDASRCFNELGQSEPNLIGSVDIRHSMTKIRDTVFRDLKAHMRRKKGFDFQIVSGELRVEEVRDGPDSSEILDFQGGAARIYLVRPGSDAARLLADFRGKRKLTLVLEDSAGHVFRLPLSMSDSSKKAPADPRRG